MLIIIFLLKLHSKSIQLFMYEKAQGQFFQETLI